MLNLVLQTTVAETITSFTVPISMGGKQEYTIGNVTECAVDGVTVNPNGTTCTIPITFTPAYPGLRGIPVRVVTSTGNINFGLNCVGVGPQVAFTPGILKQLARTTSSVTNGGDGAPAKGASTSAASLAVDSVGNLYLAEPGLQVICEIRASTGIISLIAGLRNPIPGQLNVFGYVGDGGPATSAAVNGPSDVALDSAGNIYFADNSNHVVRKINAATGIITTVAGKYYQIYGSATPSNGDGGPATLALLGEPAEIAFDRQGNLYITDEVLYQVRRVDAITGNISTVAGTGAIYILPTGTQGIAGDGGPATSAILNLPLGLAVDLAGNVYFIEDNQLVVRRVDAVTGIITTYAGSLTAPTDSNLLIPVPATSIPLNAAASVKVDPAGNVYISTSLAVFRVDVVTNVMSVVIRGHNGEDDSTVPVGDSDPAVGYKNAGVDNAIGPAIDGTGNLYVNDQNYLKSVDTTASAVRFLQPTSVSTLDTTNDPQVVNVANIGNAELQLAAPLSGTNAAISPASFFFDFTVGNLCPQVSAGSTPATINAGSSSMIALDFQPKTGGTINGSLIISDNSFSTATTETIPVQGQAIGGATLVPSTLNFGNVTVGTSSATQIATLTNLSSTTALSLTEALVGCGGGWGYPPNTYNITVTGIGGSLQHSTTVQITVK